MSYFNEVLWDTDGDGQILATDNLVIPSPYKIRQGTGAPATYAYNIVGYNGLGILFEDASHQFGLEILSDVVRFGAKTDSAVEIIQNNTAAIQIDEDGDVNVVGDLYIQGVLVTPGSLGDVEDLEGGMFGANIGATEDYSFPDIVNISVPLDTAASILTGQFRTLGAGIFLGDDAEGILQIGRFNGTPQIPTAIGTSDLIASLRILAFTGSALVNKANIEFYNNGTDSSCLFKLAFSGSEHSLFSLNPGISSWSLRSNQVEMEIRASSNASSTIRFSKSASQDFGLFTRILKSDAVYEYDFLQTGGALMGGIIQTVDDSLIDPNIFGRFLNQVNIIGDDQGGILSISRFDGTQASPGVPTGAVELGRVSFKGYLSSALTEIGALRYEMLDQLSASEYGAKLFFDIGLFSGGLGGAVYPGAFTMSVIAGYDILYGAQTFLLTGENAVQIGTTSDFGIAVSADGTELGFFNQSPTSQPAVSLSSGTLADVINALGSVGLINVTA